MNKNLQQICQNSFNNVLPTQVYSPLPIRNPVAFGKNALKQNNFEIEFIENVSNKNQKTHKFYKKYHKLNSSDKADE